MSFQRKPLVLEWPEGSEFHGLTVVTRRPTVKQIEQAETGLADRANATALSRLLGETIGKAIISWNYTDEEGMEVPATPDGFASLDIEAQTEILQMWQAKAVGVSKDLGKESDSGQPSPGAAFVMPVTGNPGLSAALQNLPMQPARSESSNASRATP